MGLRDDIKHASSSKEIELILEKSNSYTEASNKTRRSWQNTAKRRNLELATEKHSKKNVSKKTKTKKSKKS